MSKLAVTELSGDALEEAVGLLNLPPESPRPDTTMGYVDTLGETDALGPHRGQQVFHSKALTRIYERIWRPAVARRVFGRGMPEDEERRLMLAMLRLTPGQRVIDVGCGPGNYTRHLAQAAGGGLAVGIDASATMLAAAVRTGGGLNLAYVRGDGGALPFAADVFDAACCVGVIHLIEDPMAALDEMIRVVRPGGRLAILATCMPQGKARRVRSGVVFFAHDELTDALEKRNMVDIEQKVVRRGQFVAASRPEA